MRNKSLSDFEITWEGTHDCIFSIIQVSIDLLGAIRALFQNHTQSLNPEFKSWWVGYDLQNTRSKSVTDMPCLLSNNFNFQTKP